jgi:multidrug efflux pump subunit AcrA (membrane-fusion protein)
MTAEVTLHAPAAEALTVPSEALVDTGERQYVFLARDGGRFEPRRVRVGLRGGDRVQLLAGVSEGDRVVTTANFLLDSESRLQATAGGGLDPLPGDARADR